MLPWPDLFAAVRDQHHGVLVPDDGARFAIGPRAIRRRAIADRLLEPFPRAWLLSGVAPTRENHTRAASRSVGGRVLVTGFSAAAMMGLTLHPPRPELLLPHDRRTRPELGGVALYRSRSVSMLDVVPVAGLACTSLPRTALHLAATGVRETRIRDLLIDGIQQRFATLGDLVALLERTRGVTGRPALDRIVAELLRDQVDSGLELDTRRAVPLRYRLYPYPFPLACPDDRAVHLDVPLLDAFHTLECDGAGAHMDRRSFENDRVRWGHIQRAGVTITWVTRRRLRDDLAGILEEIEDAYARVDPERPPLRPAHDCRVHCRRA